MKVVVGLGNPGQKYAGTRHNVGFDVLDRLAEKYFGGPVRTKFDAELCDVEICGEKVLLVVPQTFMNLSGRPVRALVDFYKFPMSDVLVVCDDLNLEFGRLRLRASGSSGGQKGLQNIIDHLGTQQFARLRIGIGRPPGRMDPAAYVLKKFSSEEREEIDVALHEAADGVVEWATGGVQAAMNAVNAPSAKGAQPKPDKGRD